MTSVWLLKRDLPKLRCVLTRKAERLVVHNVLRVALVADLHHSPPIDAIVLSLPAR